MRSECGVFGVYDEERCGIYYVYGLFALQHQGQESWNCCGDTNGPKGKVMSCKGMGLISEVCTEENMENLREISELVMSVIQGQEKTASIILALGVIT